MPKLPGILHQQAIRAFQKAGYRIIRQGKHISMSNDKRIIIIPRANPINEFTMAGIVKSSGLTLDEFKALL